jgi:uncharacterized protein DUF6152
MRSRLVAGFVAMGVIGCAASAWPHHAHGNYAVDTVDFDGVVTELHLLVPHSWVYLEVTKLMARSSCGRSKPAGEAS